MQPQASISPYTDHTVLVAWRQGIAEASKTPDLKHRLRQRERELLPRFAEHYGKLKALPRRMRRRLQRQWRKSLAGIALVLALGMQPALAATINVGGTCTLVRAINAVNNDSTAGGRCTQGAGADRLVLTANSTVTLRTVNYDFYGPTGLPVIRSVITIVGNDSTIRRAPSAPQFRIFAVAGDGDLRLRRTTVSGGNAGVLGVGGVLNVGSVTLRNSTISGNTGAGVLDTYVCCEDYGELTAINSTISGNFGNGVVDREGRGVTLLNSTVSGNEGVGIGLAYVNLTMINSTVSGNSGAGINSFYSLATITNSTISGNSGGGVRIFESREFILARTLISGNVASQGREVNNYNGTIIAGNFNLFGHRGITNAQAFENFTPGATDITSTSDGNTPKTLSAILNTNLAKNGGPTRTHALVQGSPAIDAVTNVSTCPPPARDQRGITRPQDGNGDGGRACDIGSFERRPPTP
jgi:hypothetical protein